MSNVIYTSKKGPKRYLVEQANWGSDSFYGGDYYRFRLSAVLDAWFSGSVSAGKYHFRVIDTWVN